MLPDVRREVAYCPALGTADSLRSDPGHAARHQYQPAMATPGGDDTYAAGRLSTKPSIAPVGTTIVDGAADRDGLADAVDVGDGATDDEGGTDGLGVTDDEGGTVGSALPDAAAEAAAAAADADGSPLVGLADGSAGVGVPLGTTGAPHDGEQSKHPGPQSSTTDGFVPFTHTSSPTSSKRHPPIAPNGSPSSTRLTKTRPPEHRSSSIAGSRPPGGGEPLTSGTGMHSKRTRRGAVEVTQSSSNSTAWSSLRSPCLRRMTVKGASPLGRGMSAQVVADEGLNGHKYGKPLGGSSDSKFSDSSTRSPSGGFREMRWLISPIQPNGLPSSVGQLGMLNSTCRRGTRRPDPRHDWRNSDVHRLELSIHM